MCSHPEQLHVNNFDLSGVKLRLSAPRVPEDCPLSLHNCYAARFEIFSVTVTHHTHTPHPSEHTCRPRLHPATPCLPGDLQESLVRGKQAGSHSCARPPFSMCESKCVCIYA